MKNIYLTKRFKFSAAHRMYNGDFSKAENDKHFGICSNIHGHNYVLEVTVEGIIDESKGYFVNLHELAGKINEKIINRIDHQYLNDILPGCNTKPVTLEVLSLWIWEILTKEMDDYDFSKVQLWETEDNSVEIYRSK